MVSRSAACVTNFTSSCAGQAEVRRRRGRVGGKGRGGDADRRVGEPAAVGIADAVICCTGL